MEELSPEDPSTVSPSQSRVYRESCSLCHGEETSINRLKDAETHWEESEQRKYLLFLLNDRVSSRGMFEPQDVQCH